MIRVAVLAAILALAACNGHSGDAQNWSDGLQPDKVQSGYAFLTQETQALQDDAFANPGLLWVDRGEALFTSSDQDGKTCVACHSDGLIGAAASYPDKDVATGDLVNLEGRINLCRTRYQEQEPLAYESEALLALTAYVASQSRGMPYSVRTDGDMQAHYENGRAYFYTRRGQFNLSCHQCHDQSYGAKLRGDTISQGHANGFPSYRLEWQGMGSSHRRLYDCDTGVRAEPLNLGNLRYIEVELFLAARAASLPLESPAVRR